MWAAVLQSLIHTLRPPQDAKKKMEQLEGALQSAETGQDLGSSRGLQRQHCQLERESQALASKMAALVSQAHQGLTSQTVMEETQKYLLRYPPAFPSSPHCVPPPAHEH